MALSHRSRFLTLLVAVPGLAFAQLKEVGDGSNGPVAAAHVTAELIAGGPAKSIAALSQIALVLHLEQGWHVYWVNAGDSGEPPAVNWKLPPGISVGAMQFPVPKRLPVGPLMDYGYEGTAVFPFDVKRVPQSIDSRSSADGKERTDSHLQAHVRWLVCREVCVPGRAFLGLTFSRSNQPTNALDDLIAAAVKTEPQALPDGESIHVSGSKDQFSLAIDTGKRESFAEFYPLDEDALRNAAEQKLQASARGAVLTLERGDVSDTLPKRLHGVIKLSEGRAYSVDAHVEATATAKGGSGNSGLGFTLSILLALAGGLLLNLMPCVFPVLFLKALSLASGADEDRRTQALHGFTYSAGILLSFWTIVGVLLVLRAGGRQAGWGFQLQSPSFVVLMALLLFFMALSLAGQFEIGLSLMSKGDALTRKRGYTGSFLPACSLRWWPPPVRRL